MAESSARKRWTTLLALAGFFLLLFFAVVWRHPPWKDVAIGDEQESAEALAIPPGTEPRDGSASIPAADGPAPPFETSSARAAAAKPLFRVQGTVRDAVGAPLAGARVEAIDMFAPIGRAPRPSASTDDDGAFVLDTGGLPLGVVRACLAGYENELKEFDAAGASGEIEIADGRPVASARIDLVMRAIADPLHGRVLDDGTNAGIGMARVAVGPLGLGGETTTDVQGFFAFEDVDGGDDFFRRWGGPSLTVEAKGYAPRDLNEGTIGADGIIVRLERESGGAIQGRVVGKPSGTSVAGAVVEGRSRNGGRSRAVADEFGHYRLGGLADDEWAVESAPPGGFVDGSDGNRVLVEGGVTAWLDLELFDPVAVAGTVLDEATREPLAGAIVSAGMRVSFADASGRFHVDGVRPTRGAAIFLAARATGYHEGSVRLLPGADDTSRIEIALRRTGPDLVVRVVDEAGAPVANAIVREEGSWFLSHGGHLSTGQDGECRTPFHEHPAGRKMHLKAFEPVGGRQGSVVVEIPAGDEEPRADIVLREGRSVLVTVVGADQTPVPAVTVSLGSGTHYPISIHFEATTNERGVAEIGHLWPALYYAYVRRDRTQLLDKADALDLRGENPPESLVLFLEDGAFRVHGVVADPDGNPVVGVAVASDNMGETRTTTTDEAGRYELALRSGFYILNATKDGWQQGVGVVDRLPEQTDLRIDIALQPASVVFGAMAAEDGEPYRGSAQVSVEWKGDDGVVHGLHGAVRVSLVADGDGNFQLPAPHVSAAEMKEFAAIVDAGPAGSGRSEWLRSKPGRIGPLDVVLAPRRRLEGIVVAAESGRPLAGVAVSAAPIGEGALRFDISDSISRPVATTDSEGRFVLEPIFDSDKRLRFDAPERGLYELPIPEVPSHERPRFALEQRTAWTGRLLMNGAPSTVGTQMWLSISYPFGASGRRIATVSAGDGRFEFKEVPPGTVDLSAGTGDNAVWMRRTVHVPAVGEHRADVAFPPRYSVTATRNTATDAPQFRLAPTDGGSWGAECMLVGDSATLLLPAGKFAVEIQEGGNKWKSAGEATIVPGGANAIAAPRRANVPPAP